jgi:hypothetical protein
MGGNIGLIPFRNGEHLTYCLRCSGHPTHVCLGDVPLACYCAAHAEQHERTCQHVATGRSKVVTIDRARGRP